MNRFRFFMKNKFLLCLFIFLFGKIDISIGQKSERCFAKAQMPAIYETYRVTVESSTNCSRENIDIPAQYTTIVKTRLVCPAGILKKVEVICEKDLTKEKLTLIYNSLGLEGYPICGSSSLKSALEDYQKHNDLPVGHFDFQTMKHLKIEF